ncbi:MAG: peptidoglycan DD-metalloendopeptidase family protein [Rhodospirillales bacterium]|nr:peptidoglycan DD-metalloendopeptidase family protein [Alphaproteobacteria bacterium]MBL6947797.1 peptidoglycan DD-metalloendopeptidase family protein [Rhodospirillales bacterium]
MQRLKQPASFSSRIHGLLDRLFPERQIHLRTEGKVSFVRLSQRTQIALSLVFLACLGWATFSSLSFVRNESVLAAKDSEIGNSKQAYRNLLGEVSEYQKKFTNLSSDLEDSHALMVGLVEKNASLRHSLSKVSKKLDLTKSEREQIASARESLKSKLSTIESKMRNISSQNFSLADNLSTAEADLQNALAERNKSLYEGTRMRRRIKNLEGRLTDLQKTEEQVIQRLSDSTATYIETMEKVVSVAGLNLNKLLKGFDLQNIAQGGPFIAAGPEDLPGKEMRDSLANLDVHLSRWEALQSLMRRIPLAPPLNAYYITSGYGKRRDPINRRWAAHYGLDMGGPVNSSVYATAPGVVSYAGRKGKYGKLIEIDHGAGLKTRFGHLNRISVKKGQKVKFHQKIGLLGSTGRSTGAHLHYEVVFRGKAMNPMKFIKAGRNVFQE